MKKKTDIRSYQVINIVSKSRNIIKNEYINTSND